MKCFIVIGLAACVLPVGAAPAHRAAKSHYAPKALTLAQRQQIYLYLSQTEYLASDHFPGVSTDPTAQDAYQDKLIARVGRRFGITRAQGEAISNEGAAKLWPIMGSRGDIDHIH